LKALLISDAAALAMMEARPEPAWRVKLAGMRYKDLLAPDYGAMHVAAYLKRAGFSLRVANLVADVHDRVELYAETNTGPDELSGSEIGRPEAAGAVRSYLFDTLAREEPEVIFVTLSVYNLALHTRELLGDIRRACPGATLVTGGIYSSFHTEEILLDGHVDVVIRGEGELTAAELMARLSDGRDLDGLAGVSYMRDGAPAHNPPRPLFTDLDALPHPYTVSAEFNIRKRFEMLSELLPGGDWIPGTGFLTSRGCPEACTFCLDPAINMKRTRFHSPEYVRTVLDYCAGEFTGGAGSFFFGDATFTMNHKRLRKILGLLDGLPYTYQIQTRADYLTRELTVELAEKGFTTVAIGAESFNEEILQQVARKRLSVGDILDASRWVKEAGMHPVLTFVAGLPGETRESIWRTVEMLARNGLDTATFFPLVVFRGTELFRAFEARLSPDEREAFRLNPWSEEFLFASDEFPTREELTSFTEKVNRAIVEGHR
jgi:radical SAM superfamily enzyme YgiQ (UPF0313 family)